MGLIADATTEGEAADPDAEAGAAGKEEGTTLGALIEVLVEGRSFTRRRRLCRSIETECMGFRLSMSPVVVE